MRFAHLQSRITEILKDVFEAERTEDIVTIMPIFKNLVEMGKFLKDTTIQFHSKRTGNLNSFLCIEEIKFIKLPHKENSRAR